MAEDRFEATARIPSRPLSMENKELAFDKEVLVDYTNHTIHLCVYDENGVQQFYDITASVSADISSIVNQVIENLKDDPDLFKSIFENNENQTIIGDINITLEDGTSVTIAAGLADALTRIKALEDALGISRDENGNITSITINIDASNITTDDDHQFVSITEKEAWNNKATSTRIYAVINSGEAMWTAVDDHFEQTVDVPTITVDDYPITDVVLSTAAETAKVQLQSFSYIYKISTLDGQIKVYATQATETALSILMMVIRPINT